MIGTISRGQNRLAWTELGAVLVSVGFLPCSFAFPIAETMLCPIALRWNDAFTEPTDNSLWAKHVNLSGRKK